MVDGEGATESVCAFNKLERISKPENRKISFAFMTLFFWVKIKNVVLFNFRIKIR